MGICLLHQVKDMLVAKNNLRQEGCKIIACVFANIFMIIILIQNDNKYLYVISWVVKVHVGGLTFIQIKKNCQKTFSNANFLNCSYRFIWVNDCWPNNLNQSRGVFRTLSNILDGTILEIYSQIKAINYFYKESPSYIFDIVLNSPLQSAKYKNKVKQSKIYEYKCQRKLQI